MPLKASARKKPPPRKKAKSRKKAAAPVVESWSDVDRLIHRLARMDTQTASISADVDRDIRALKDKAAGRVALFAAERKAIAGEIEAYAKAHKADFGKDRSLRLAHGRVGWRAATRIRFAAKAEEVIARLKRRGLEVAIMVTERASKEILETFDDKVLAGLGVKRQRSDTFYIELDEAHLSRPA